MEGEIIQALTSVLTAAIGGLAVAIPSLIASHQNNRLTIYRIEQLEKTIDELTTKLDGYQDLRTEVVEIQVKLDALERELARLASRQGK